MVSYTGPSLGVYKTISTLTFSVTSNTRPIAHVECRVNVFEEQ